MFSKNRLFQFDGKWGTIDHLVFHCRGNSELRKSHFSISSRPLIVLTSLVQLYTVWEGLRKIIILLFDVHPSCIVPCKREGEIMLYCTFLLIFYARHRDTGRHTVCPVLEYLCQSLGHPSFTRKAFSTSSQPFLLSLRQSRDRRPNL